MTMTTTMAFLIAMTPSSTLIPPRAGNFDDLQDLTELRLIPVRIPELTQPYVFRLRLEGEGVRVFAGHLQAGTAVPVLGPGPTTFTIPYRADQAGQDGLSIENLNNPHTPLGKSLWVEATQPNPTARLFFELHGPDGKLVDEDVVVLRTLEIDLDIDSDNNNGFNLPDRNSAEDAIEDDPDEPGKIIWVNDGDADGDGIPGYADGFDLDSDDPDDSTSVGDRFVPLVIELPMGIDFSKAHLNMTYSASDPAEVTYDEVSGTWQPGSSGHLRIWRKDGGQTRDKNSARGVDAQGNPLTPGDYVAPGIYSDLARLGFTSGSRSVTVYVEGIRPGSAPGDQRISVEMDPDGDGPAGFVRSDAVRLSIAALKLNWMKQDWETGQLQDVDSGDETTDSSPVVSLDVGGSQLLGNGNLIVSLTGTVRDRLSEIVGSPQQRVQTLNFFVNGSLNSSIANLPAMATGIPEWPWRPSPFELSFTHLITIPNGVGGDFRIEARTSENPAGRVGWDAVGVSVKWAAHSDFAPGTVGPLTSPNEGDPGSSVLVGTVSGHLLNVAFQSPPSDQAIDSARVYFGDREPETTDPLVTETAMDSMEFTGSIITPESAPGGVPITLLIQGGEIITENGANLFEGRVTYGDPDDPGTLVEYLGVFVETSPGSLKYVLAYYTGFSTERPGAALAFLLPVEDESTDEVVASRLYVPTISIDDEIAKPVEPRDEPTIVYVTDLPESVAEDIRINVNGVEYPVKSLPNGNPNTYYVEDSNRPGWPRFFLNSPEVLVRTPAIATPNFVTADGTAAENTVSTYYSPSGQPPAKVQAAAYQFWDPKEPPQLPPSGQPIPQSGWTFADLEKAFYLSYGEVGRILLEAFKHPDYLNSRDNQIILKDKWGKGPGISGVWGIITGRRTITIDNDDQDVFQGANDLWIGLNRQKGCMRDYFTDRISNPDPDPFGVNWVELAQQSNEAIASDIANVAKAATELYMQVAATIVPGGHLVLDIADLSQGNLLAVVGYADKVPLSFVKGITVRVGGRVWCSFRGGCFAEGTLVQTPDGPVEIQDLRQGSLVLAFDTTAGHVCTQTVASVFVTTAPAMQALQVGDETIWATPGHLVWSENSGWSPVVAWLDGDHGKTVTGGFVPAEKGESVAGFQTVYNLLVDDHHNFFVGEIGLLVHNGCKVNFGWRGKSTVLRSNLKTAGPSYYPNTIPSHSPAASAAHHIVAHGDERAQEAASILRGAKLDDPDGWWNGVFLPKDTKGGTTRKWKKDDFGKNWPNASRHAPLHTGDYHLRVTERLREAIPPEYRDPTILNPTQLQDLQNILIDELDAIRTALLNGGPL